MIRHFLQIAAIAVLALAGMFYPFMPGPYDRMASPLSGMFQMLGLAGLLLAPIGMAWLMYELANRRRGLASRPEGHKARWFALCALAASLVVGAAVALSSLQAGPSLAVGVLTLCIYGTWRAVHAVNQLESGGRLGFNPVPLYLTIIPCVLATAQFTLLETAVEISRKRTIMGSVEFINAIEAYHAAHGRYPLSLESVHHDYDPPTVGVERYR